MTTYLYHDLITSDITADLGFNAYFIDASSNNIIFTLPLINGNNISYTLTRIDNSLNTVSITSLPNNFHDGSTTYLLAYNETINVVSFNNIWYYKK